ncbi:hypothetical protein Mapa_018523 [Marchantia paleacea]|nr:hypothetical protein Mapa_018523 [Marchantia paleacea]
MLIIRYILVASIVLTHQILISQSKGVLFALCHYNVSILKSHNFSCGRKSILVTILVVRVVSLQCPCLPISEPLCERICITSPLTFLFFLTSSQFLPLLHSSPPLLHLFVQSPLLLIQVILFAFTSVTAFCLLIFPSLLPISVLVFVIPFL